MEREQFIFFITDGYKESFSILTKGEEKKNPTWLLYLWPFPVKNARAGWYSFLRGIFPNQGSNPGLLHCRQIPYQLETPEKPNIKTAFLFSKKGEKKSGAGGEGAILKI